MQCTWNVVLAARLLIIMVICLWISTEKVQAEWAANGSSLKEHRRYQAGTQLLSSSQLQ